MTVRSCARSSRAPDQPAATVGQLTRQMDSTAAAAESIWRARFRASKPARADLGLQGAGCWVGNVTVKVAP